MNKVAYKPLNQNILWKRRKHYMQLFKSATNTSMTPLRSWPNTLLMQSGAKGSIDIADTIDDPSVLDGYVMAGSYIRPFTVDLSYTYSF